VENQGPYVSVVRKSYKTQKITLYLSFDSFNDFQHHIFFIFGPILDFDSASKPKIQFLVHAVIFEALR
jgi:hypothetical protein